MAITYPCLPLLLVSVLLTIKFPPSLASEDAFPGWMGERHFSKRGEEMLANSKPATERDTAVFVVDPTKVKSLSWKPRTFLYKGFLTGEECDHLISLARTGLQRSAVADNDSGKSELSSVRTSSGTFIQKDKDKVVSRIEGKIATWTFLRKENGEPIQVLRYGQGEKYEPHYDYFHDKINQARGGHRIATVLMYLTDVVKGGETVFPKAERGRRFIHDTMWSECGKQGIAVKPTRGDALLFFHLAPDTTPDAASIHAGCPVVEGEKWSATKWIHMESFDEHIEDFRNSSDESQIL